MFSAKPSKSSSLPSSHLSHRNLSIKGSTFPCNYISEAMAAFPPPTPCFAVSRVVSPGCSSPWLLPPPNIFAYLIYLLSKITYHPANLLSSLVEGIRFGLLEISLSVFCFFYFLNSLSLTSTWILCPLLCPVSSDLSTIAP